MNWRRIILTFSLITCCYLAPAQEKFTEGILTYDITITGKVPTPADEPSLIETKSGIMTIYIKNGNLRQDIQLEDGYSHSRIISYNISKEIILQTINTAKYAIETGLNDQQNTDFTGAVLQRGYEHKRIAGNDAYEATLKYRNGALFPFYYIDKYELPYPEIFERSPELKGIPAEFDVPMSNGFSTHFTLKKIDAVPVPTATFKVPAGYRIISKKEYDKLMQ